ncbi:restriction endonuclease subunit S [Photobacterium leiognathi]|uniref:restriction endonuclease subunit S n=1 Tax=Photobacterium leiognathi TaxID=553611 RepID=UPI000D1572EB|nr:restriction endonuclease subunit S [Photobacterium leiognathi]PSW45682.1 hypothetical protein C0W40_05170 [Photobacterium leiognathi subsp. mandapamensis]
MSNIVPSNWKNYTLSHVCNIVGGGTPDRNNPNFWVDGDILWVSPTEVTKLQGRYISDTKEKITCLGLNKSSAKLHPIGTVLMTSRASIGFVAISTVPISTNQGFQSLQCKKDIYNEYLYQYITWIRPRLETLSAGSTFSEISSSTLKALQITLPPFPEQQKIATILMSVDDVIEKTQAQINKLKDLKTGMMQELLTCGVGVDSKPHTEFKDSSVGRIPKAWDCCLLDKVAKRGSGHTPDKQKPEYWNGGIKWVSLTDSSRLDKLHLYETSKEISQLGIDNSSATLHSSGTVVMARDAGVGKSAIIQSPMAVSQHFMAWTCGDKLDNYFLYYLLQYWKPKFENIAMGSTIKTIGLPFFKKLQIPLPSLGEQKAITKSLKAVENNIFKLEEKNAKNKAMKKALMQDLLTGKVRVNVE